MPITLNYSGAGAGGNFFANPITQNDKFRSDPTVSGGTSPFTYSIASGTLPGGLTLDPSGVIYGTCTATYTGTFVVKVVDALPGTASSTISAVVTQLQKWNKTLPPGVKNVAYSYVLSTDYAIDLFNSVAEALDLSKPITYTPLLWSGADPGGMSLSTNTTGISTLAGTPVNINSFPGFTNDFNASIEVNGTLSNNTPSQVSANNPWHVFSSSFTPSSAPTCSLTGTLQPADILLIWTTTNGPTTATIDQGVGAVNPNGGTLSLSIPGTTTVYHLTVSNTSGTSTCTTTITIPPGGGGNSGQGSNPIPGGGIQTSNASFKLWSHWNDNRIEPPRVLTFDSDRISGGEQWWRQVSCDINPLGGTVTGVFYLDEVAVATFTLSPGPSSPTYPVGTGRQIFPFPISATNQATERYGKVGYMRYSSATPFKHYRTWYHTEPTPDRLSFYESSYLDMPSEGVIKTWLAELQIFGTGTTPGCIGTVFLDGVVVQTATFTHNTRKIVEVALPNITVGKSLKAVYNAIGGALFKHWRTDFEIQPKPFYKTQWVTIYRKPSALTQLDQLRFFQLDLETAADVGEGTNTSTITSTWFIDGTAFTTNTFTLAAGQRIYYDRVSFPPGGFGYLIQQQLSADQPFHLWSSSLDAEHIGVKGFARTIHIPGTPQDQQEVKPAEGRIEQRPRTYLGY